jgi:hypothetical protein
MLALGLLCLLAWIAPQARAQACGPATPSGKFADPSILADKCSGEFYDRAGRREMPPAIQTRQSELMQQLHPANLLMERRKIERGCMPAAQAWPHRANLYLVPFETMVREQKRGGGEKEASRSLAIALVRVSGDGACLSVIAKTAQPLERKGELELDHFDFAPYRLNAHETAFGLRSFFNTAYVGGGGRDEVLELFRVKDGVIEPILWTLVASSSFRHGEQDGDPKGAVIRVLPTKTNGVFDLKKRVRGGGAAIFRWNGHAYETHNPEPVECLNDPCYSIQWELATQGQIDASSAKCPNSLGASVFANADDDAGVLGAIPDGNRVKVYLSRSTADFYWAEGDGFEDQGRLRGYIYRDCAQMDPGQEARDEE